jgi:hypothetical protein
MNGRNVDVLTFDTAVFDRDGKLVSGRHSPLDLRLTDEKLQQLLLSGINVQTSFELSPGTYGIREVIQDTETKKSSALTCSIEVP